MSQLEILLTKVAREQDELLAAGNGRELARLRLFNTQFREPRSTLAFGMRLAIAAGLTLITAVGAYQWESHRVHRLTATMGQSAAPVVQGTWITASDSMPTPVQFSDGTRVEIAPRAQARMIELEPNRVQLALESGRADVHVVHHPTRDWQLRAGPFGVHVTGTRFNLSWYPNQDQFALELVEGQVELSGCGFGARRRLIAGQSVRASCRTNSVEIAYSDPRGAVSATAEAVLAPGAIASPPENAGAKAAESPRSAKEAPRANLASRAATATHEPSRPAASAPDFLALASEGKYVEALAAVEQRGFSSECARLNVDALSQLAEAARHARKPSMAREALLTLRRRFPGSSQSALAAFSLGVLEFDQWGAFRNAIDWFSTYLTEAPAGALAREARGRIMEAAYRSGRADASELAAAYLRVYPEGPHAALARLIVKSAK
jgi:hypothetical protein